MGDGTLSTPATFVPVLPTPRSDPIPPAVLTGLTAGGADELTGRARSTIMSTNSIVFIEIIKPQ
jgi:hypothetical protein